MTRGGYIDECGSCLRCRDCGARWCESEDASCPWCREDGADCG